MKYQQPQGKTNNRKPPLFNEKLTLDKGKPTSYIAKMTLNNGKPTLDNRIPKLDKG